jgi:hypothetical protein
MLAGRMSFFDLGRTSAADPFYGIALEAAQAAHDRALEAVALGNRSFILRNSGNTSQALTLLQRAKYLAVDVPTIRSWGNGIGGDDTRLGASARREPGGDGAGRKRHGGCPSG